MQRATLTSAKRHFAGLPKQAARWPWSILPACSGNPGTRRRPCSGTGGLPKQAARWPWSILPAARNPGTPEEAVQWYRRAAEAGSQVAMVDLAGLLRESGHAGEAVQWYRRAAEAGSQVAMVDLALPGNPGTRERPCSGTGGLPKQAARWPWSILPLLRESGHAGEAVQWYRRAAEAGSQVAMVDLARLLWENHHLEGG